MFFRRFFRFALVIILLVGMFGLASSAAYRSGWSQGFVSGQTADGGTAENVPAAPGYRGFGHGVFSFLGWMLAAFFKFWLFLFFIGLIFKFLFWGRRGWRHGKSHGHWKGQWKGGPWGGWHGHHQHHEKGGDFKGQRPPWYDDSDGEPVMKA